MPTKPNISASDRISQAFGKLTDSAAVLNDASDEFSKAIAPVDNALKKLNLGVKAWHRYFNSGPDQDGDYWERHIGYAKVGGKWGLALSSTNGNLNYEDTPEQWLFNDAPRWMRVEAIDHIPALLEELVKQANNMTADLKTKTEKARELALTIAAESEKHDG